MATSSAAVAHKANLPVFALAIASSESVAVGALKATIVCKVPNCSLAASSSTSKLASHSAKLMRAFSTISPSSLARRSGMVATAINPALTTANQASAMPMELPPRSSTRLPGTRPKSSVSTLAIWSTRSPVPLYVRLKLSERRKIRLLNPRDKTFANNASTKLTWAATCSSGRS